MSDEHRGRDRRRGGVLLAGLFFDALANQASERQDKRKSLI
jgi:hypothetical protein